MPAAVATPAVTAPAVAAPAVTAPAASRRRQAPEPAPDPPPDKKQRTLGMDDPMDALHDGGGIFSVISDDDAQDAASTTQARHAGTWTQARHAHARREMRARPPHMSCGGCCTSDVCARCVPTTTAPPVPLALPTSAPSLTVVRRVCDVT